MKIDFSIMFLSCLKLFLIFWPCSSVSAEVKASEVTKTNPTIFTATPNVNKDKDITDSLITESNYTDTNTYIETITNIDSHTTHDNKSNIGTTETNELFYYYEAPSNIENYTISNENATASFPNYNEKGSYTSEDDRKSSDVNDDNHLHDSSNGFSYDYDAKENNYNAIDSNDYGDDGTWIRNNNANLQNNNDDDETENNVEGMKSEGNYFDTKVQKSGDDTEQHEYFDNNDSNYNSDNVVYYFNDTNKNYGNGEANDVDDLEENEAPTNKSDHYRKVIQAMLRTNNRIAFFKWLVLMIILALVVFALTVVVMVLRRNKMKFFERYRQRSRSTLLSTNNTKPKGAKGNKIDNFHYSPRVEEEDDDAMNEDTNRLLISLRG